MDDDNAFADVDVSGDTSDTSTTDADTPETFVDMASSSVRTLESDDYRNVGGGVYESKSDDRSVDHVDSRGLHKLPTISELRYHYQQTPYASTVVDKPVEDAFKYGYQIHGDPTKKVGEFLDDYVPVYKSAEQKARRDGFAVIYFQLVDENPQYKPPSNVSEIDRLRILTLDHFSSSGGTVPRDVIETTEFDRDQLHVTDSGLVVVDDITHPDDEELLGYAIDTDGKVPADTDVDEQTFIHADRCQHLAWNDTVDGNPEERTFGKHEGESVLTSALHPLRALDKGDWAMGEALFRYSAPVYAVETPDDYGEDEFDTARDLLHDLSTASEMVLPPGTAMDVYDGASEFDPEPFYDVLVEEIAAATEFTKSVLLGTQTGTVSGSETDVKNYFNAVQVAQQNRHENKIDEAVWMVNGWNLSLMPTFALGYEIEWEPLFKVDEVERANGLARIVDAAGGAISSYVMTPDEARDFVEAEFMEFDADVDLDTLTEDEMDTMDRVNLRSNSSNKGASDDEAEVGGNVRAKNTNAEGEGGGTDVGETTESSTPTTDALLDHVLVDADFDTGAIVATPDGVGVVTEEHGSDFEYPDGGSQKTIPVPDDKTAYVVGFGGESGVYYASTLTHADSVESDQSTDGETLASVSTVDVTGDDLPEGWTVTSLLSWWASIGGTFNEAQSELVEERNLSEQQANEIAATYKTKVLGTDRWR